MPAISFHLAVAPSYLFIYHRSHIINAMQTITGNVCANSNKSAVTVHAYVSSNGICRGFAFKYGKFLLPPRFLTALSVPKVPTREQYQNFTFPLLFLLPIFPFSSIIMILVHFGTCFFICRQFFHILQVPAILMFSFFDDFHDHFHTHALKR